MMVSRSSLAAPPIHASCPVRVLSGRARLLPRNVTTTIKARVCTRDQTITQNVSGIVPTHDPARKTANLFDERPWLRLTALIGSSATRGTA